MFSKLNLNLLILDEINCENFTQCDFENGLCDWANNLDSSSKIDWQLNKGQLMRGTGPRRDHTIGTREGQYIYLGNYFKICIDLVKTNDNNLLF